MKIDGIEYESRPLDKEALRSYCIQLFKNKYQFKQLLQRTRGLPDNVTEALFREALRIEPTDKDLEDMVGTIEGVIYILWLILDKTYNQCKELVSEENKDDILTEVLAANTTMTADDLAAHIKQLRSKCQTKSEDFSSHQPSDG